jgi:predicted nucleotidyltransferase
MRKADSAPSTSSHAVLWQIAPVIQAQLDQITRSLCEAAGQNLTGIYLHGSLALGCFNAQRSDIDLLAITHSPLDAGAIRTLFAALLEISNQPRPIEISVTHYAQIVPWRYPTAFDLHFSETHRLRTAEVLATPDAKLPEGGLDPDLAAHFTVLRKRGVCLYGAPIASLGVDVPWADYLDSLRLDFEWAQQPTAIDAVYAVLNACRIWAAVESQTVLSKAEGARWASSRLPAEWRSLVEAVASCYAGTPRELSEAEARTFLGWIRKQLGWK